MFRVPDWRREMDQIFMTNLTIKEVRHLRDIPIPLSKENIRHLVLTGKNGSGKTSVLEALAGYIENVVRDEDFGDREQRLRDLQAGLNRAFENNKSGDEIIQLKETISRYKRKLEQSQKGLDVCFNQSLKKIFWQNQEAHYILAFYRADRIFQTEQPRHVEKVQLKDEYDMTESPRNEFAKYLLDLKMTEALARGSRKIEKADEIQAWFESLEQLLKKIFEDDSIKLEFDEDTFAFHILQQGREPFDFNTLSSGYQAVLDIVLDIMMRMVSRTQRSFDFKVPGIVLIDEIETHLHLELQKNIMPLLTTIFPNIQFVVTSHSPFILNSLENAVVYDLENHLLVENGLNNLPYEGIVEGYFKADTLSDMLKEKFERYRNLVRKKSLSDDEVSEIAELEFYLDEIPDYLAIGLTTEYQKLKLEYMNREDIDG